MSTGRNAPIGIFDSGVGGLSVMQEIHRLLPHEDLIYIADSANAPYGDRSSDFIRSRSLALSRHLAALGCKTIVVACNTATTEAISYLREQLELPFVGVEPAIKPAAQQSRNGKIGVMATHRTTRSLRTQRLIEEHASHAEVILQACPGLVELVEELAEHPQPISQQLLSHLEPLLAHDIDTLVLGCTHYPFLRQHIEKIVGEDILLLDTGKPVAEQIRRVLLSQQLENQATHNTSITILTTHADQMAERIIRFLWPHDAQIRVLQEADLVQV